MCTVELLRGPAKTTPQQQVPSATPGTHSLPQQEGQLCSVMPCVPQGELHKYCTTWDEADVRSSGDGGRAGYAPPRQLQVNQTDCGWAPFGECLLDPLQQQALQCFHGNAWPRAALLSTTGQPGGCGESRGGVPEAATGSLPPAYG